VPGTIFALDDVPADRAKYIQINTDFYRNN
jgi:hypothetical protein